MEAWRGTWERDRFRGDMPLDAYVTAVFRHPVGTVNYTYELWQNDSHNTTYSLPAYLDALAPLAAWMPALEPFWRADTKTVHSLPDYMQLVLGCGLDNVADLLPLWGRDAARWDGDFPDWLGAVAKVQWGEGTELIHAVYAEDTVTTLTLPEFAGQLGDQDNVALNVALTVWSEEPYRSRSFLDYVAFVAARLSGYTLDTIIDLWAADTHSQVPFPDYGAYIEQFPWHHVQLLAQAWAGEPSDYCGFLNYLARSGQVTPPPQPKPPSQPKPPNRNVEMLKQGAKSAAWGLTKMAGRAVIRGIAGTSTHDGTNRESRSSSSETRAAMPSDSDRTPTASDSLSRTQRERFEPLWRADRFTDRDLTDYVRKLDGYWWTEVERVIPLWRRDVHCTIDLPDYMDVVNRFWWGDVEKRLPGWRHSDMSLPDYLLKRP